MNIDQRNDLDGGIDWKDIERVHQTTTIDIPAMVAEGRPIKNAREYLDRENAPERA